MLNGRSQDWGPQHILDDAAVAYTQTAPNSTRVQQASHLFLVHMEYEPNWGRTLNGNKQVNGPAQLGCIDVVPGECDASASWTDTKRSIRLDIEPRRLQRLAGWEYNSSDFELQPPKLGNVDIKAHMLALLIQNELTNADYTSVEMIDALVVAFSIHILRSYSSVKRTHMGINKGGISPFLLRKLQNYIDENINTSIDILQMASLVGITPSHFIRIFKNSTGQSPHQFLISRRLAHARRLVTSSEKDFNTIAKETGFSSHSHMTALMRRKWGTTPLKMRRIEHLGFRD